MNPPALWIDLLHSLTRWSAVPWAATVSFLHSKTNLTLWTKIYSLGMWAVYRGERKTVLLPFFLTLMPCETVSWTCLFLFCYLGSVLIIFYQWFLSLLKTWKSDNKCSVDERKKKSKLNVFLHLLVFCYHQLPIHSAAPLVENFWPVLHHQMSLVFMATDSL